MKYLVQQKAEHDSWERKKDLENVKEVVAEFEGRVKAKVRRQEKLDIAEKKNFRKRELLGRYMAKFLYGQDDRKFENEYLKRLERNWQRQKLVSLKKKS